MSAGLFVPLLLGLVAGAGTWLFITGLWPQPRPLGVLLAELEDPYVAGRAGGMDSVLARVAAAAAGGVGPQLQQDLAVLDRTLADHSKAKLQNALVLAAFPVAAYAVFTAGSGLFISPAILGLGTVGFGTLGWLVTDRVTRQRANQRRAEIRASLVTYLQLVATMLAGGAGPNEALWAVTRFGSGPGFDELAAALNESRVRGVTPWVVFARVAERKGIVELDELAAAVELAGSSGARIRASLLTKATSLRQAELAQTQSDAAAASESMGVPVGVMLLGFVVAIGFPAFMAILQI
ncbi:MAG: hypothetical protein GY929_16530 [Actinomycetia bacterium]|nr:hypothetical protein [Actinomycetes bacterium]